MHAGNGNANENKNAVVIGIDGGGTHTRVMVSDLHGHILGYVEKGAASLYKDLNARQNVTGAILEALKLAGAEPARVAGLAAGIAGYDSEDDAEWVQNLTKLESLHGPAWHFNDTVAAHFGALLAKPGIVVISGTGSNIMALTEKGQYISNYAFRHYAASAARFIAYDAVYEALAGNVDNSDEQLLQSLFNHWGVQSMEQLYTVALNGFEPDLRERDKHFGQLAPAITEAALHGSRLARTVCDRAIEQIKVGIELLAASFSEPTVSVTLIGSVVRSAYFRQKLASLLEKGNRRSFTVIEPLLTPVAGSVLYALNELNRSDQISMDPIIANLLKNQYALFR